ncbi:MAG: DUF1460 domain-containing protein [Lewinellaceae bacterium]|nr:DUF1460 domain-containing protein [Lewinellaceae bacterium]
MRHFLRTKILLLGLLCCMAMMTPEDLRVLQDKSALARNISISTTGRMLAVAESFLGTPYVVGTLESPGPECLITNLQALDCWTFVECSLAIAQTADSALASEQAFTRAVRQLRYWGGRIDGYGSRIHYFSGWLLQAEKSGILDDITPQLGGVQLHKHIDFMSRHAEKYTRLNDPAVLQQIVNAEKRLNQHTWTYIPQDRIESIEHLIHEGDIIAITSAKTGLDFSHEGFAVRRNGRVHLLHASSLGKKVIVSSQLLGDYVRSQRGQTGIVVARVRE